MLAWTILIFQMFCSVIALWAGYLCFRAAIDKEFAKNPPFMPSFGEERKTILAEVSKVLENSEPLTVMDPGCGAGDLIISLAKKFKQHTFIGVELSTPVSLLCRFRARKLKNLTVIKSDLFKASFKECDIIVCFLHPPLMHRLGEKIKAECKKDVSVFSNSFTIDNLHLVQEFKTKKKSFVENVYQYSIEE